MSPTTSTNRVKGVQAVQQSLIYITEMTVATGARDSTDPGNPEESVGPGPSRPIERRSSK